MKRRSMTAWLGTFPVPKEHGAWVIVYAPIVIGAVASGRARAVPLLLLVVAVTGLYLARNAATLLLRRGWSPRLGVWLTVYTAVAVAGLAPLLSGGTRGRLLALGAIAAALFAVNAALSTVRSRKRLDRSLAGELLGVVGLTLTGPAALVVCGAPLDASLWRFWAILAAFFGSGIAYVKTVLATASSARKMGGAGVTLSLRLKLRAGAVHLVYHIGLLALAIAEALQLGGVAGALVVLAVAPACWRAVTGWARMSATLPPLRRVGFAESGIALWFTVLIAVALRLGGRA